MLNEFHKMVICGMIAEVYSQTTQLCQEYERIKTELTAASDDAANSDFVHQTALEVIHALEAADHSGKLQTVLTALDRLREKVLTASSQADISEVAETVDRVESELATHFNELLPELHDKLKQAMRQRVEMN